MCILAFTVVCECFADFSQFQELRWVCKLLNDQRPSTLERKWKMLVSALQCMFRETEWTFTAIIAVQFTMTHWSTTAHMIILSLDKLTLYKLTNCQKQIVRQSQLIMLASVLHYTFKEAHHTSANTDVQYITTLKNITVHEEMLWWVNNLCEIIKRCVCVWTSVHFQCID